MKKNHQRGSIADLMQKEEDKLIEIIYLVEQRIKNNNKKEQKFREMLDIPECAKIHGIDVAERKVQKKSEKISEEIMAQKTSCI